MFSKGFNINLARRDLLRFFHMPKGLLTRKLIYKLKYLQTVTVQMPVYIFFVGGGGGIQLCFVKV